MECDIINIEKKKEIIGNGKNSDTKTKVGTLKATRPIRQGKVIKTSQLSEYRDNSGAINATEIAGLCWLDDRRLLKTKQLE